MEAIKELLAKHKALAIRYAAAEEASDWDELEDLCQQLESLETEITYELHEQFNTDWERES